MNVTPALKPLLTAEDVIELDNEVNYFMVSVDWEYDVAHYIMAHDRIDAIKADFTDRVSRLRDEGFVIIDVRNLNEM